MNDERPLVERLVEVAVYAPAGLAAHLVVDLPGAVRAARERVEHRLQVARFVGEMAVTYGRNELIKRLEDAAPAAAADDADAATAADVTTGAERRPDHGDDAGERAPQVDDVDVPFAGYDTLPAAHVVQRLRRLAAGELLAVRRYEAAHRARRTVIAKVDQLLEA